MKKFPKGLDAMIKGGYSLPMDGRSSSPRSRRKATQVLGG